MNDSIGYNSFRDIPIYKRKELSLSEIKKIEVNITDIKITTPKEGTKTIDIAHFEISNIKKIKSDINKLKTKINLI